jgi:hypothetical protein
MLKQESYILIAFGIFAGIVAAVYWFWGHEDSGGVMLVGALLLGLMPGLYYYYWYRRSGGQRPEDRPNATVAEGAGTVDAFPSTSIWPFVLGSGCFFFVLALVFGIWLLVPGLSLVLAAFIGATAESRRGGSV